MAHWRDQLRDHLDHLQHRHSQRRLRAIDRCALHVQRDGRSLINLASNDYLGLASHPKLRDAAIDAATRFGVGAGASRLLTGHLQIHQQVERCFAEFKHAEAALLLPTGYMAAMAALTSLAEPGDLLCLDKLCHASLIDAARASDATVRVYPHRNLDKLERLLDRAAARRKLIVTDSVFSMDGDCADLPALCDLRDRHDAILIVDEAHATGVLGETGSGLAEAQGVADRMDVVISTASKALGCLGGIVIGPQVVIDTLVNAARSFIYTTAVPPMQAAAIGAALEVIRDEPHRRVRLDELSQHLRRELRGQAWTVADDPTPIIPLVVGDPAAALALADRLEQAGFAVPAIRPPTVAPGSCRLRISLRADLEDGDIGRLLDALGKSVC